MSHKVGIIGMGRWGSSLAFGLKAFGCQVDGFARGDERTLHDFCRDLEVLCLCVRDDQLVSLVAHLSGSDLSGKTALIHSGTKPLAVAVPLEKAGARIGKFHPLQAFTQVREQAIPEHTHFAFEGDIEDLVAPWVSFWSGKLHHLVGDQWRDYHLAAVTAANFLPLLIRRGAAVLRPHADSDQDALDWLAPLVLQSVHGALNAGLQLPYSGPAVRGDEEVIEAHLSMLAEQPLLAALYRTASTMIAADRDGKRET